MRIDTVLNFDYYHFDFQYKILTLSCLGGVAATTFESNFFAAAWSFSESELPLFSLSSKKIQQLIHQPIHLEPL